MVVESGLLLMTLAKLSEHGAEAGDGALLDGAEGVASVLVPGTLSSAAPLLIRGLGPAHWKGVESVFTQTHSPGHMPSKPGLGPEPWDSPRVSQFTWIHPRGLHGSSEPRKGRAGPALASSPGLACHHGSRDTHDSLGSSACSGGPGPE